MDEWDRSLISHQQLMEDLGMNKDEMAKYIMDMYEQKNRKWMYASDEDDITVSEEDQFWDEDEEPYDEGDVDAEFATILMDELTANGLDSHILLKYPEIADWWGGVLKERQKRAEALRKREETKRKKEEDKRARDALLARLTPEEKRLLGVK